MKLKTLLLVISILFLTKAQTITFHVNDLVAGPPDCNWMFQTDDAPNFSVHDGNPFTPSVTTPDWNNYAYREFTWSLSKPTSSSCINEELSVLEGTAGVTLKLYGFVLKSFRHINTVNPNNAWNTPGQAGDERTYAGGIGEIYVDGVLKLKAINCRLSVVTPYPTAAQMNSVLGGNYFTNNVGTGEPVTGSGWGVIDKDNSNGDWVTALDPHETGQLEFDLSTISAVIQDYWGYFDFDILIKPSTIVENLNFDDDVEIPIEANAVVDLPASEVSFSFSSLTSDNGGLKSVLANQILSNPGGALPDGIVNIAPQMYWKLGTTFKEFEGSVTFDISGIPGISAPENLRILKRNNSASNWEILGSYTLVNSTTIRAENLTSFSEFAIGSTGDNSLPVELTSFTAATTKDGIQLHWETATEVNNYGFEVQRSVASSQRSEEMWENVGFVAGHGNSNSTKEYSFVDESVPSGKYSYRLKQIDTDGGFFYSDEIIVETLHVTSLPTEYTLFQNYPNPFNPSTTIKFGLPKDSKVVLEVFNIIGEKVTTLINGEMQAGIHNYQFSIDNYQLSSGIYIYKLTTEGFTSTKKFVLMK